MKTGRILGRYLSFCLAAILILSGIVPMEAHADLLKNDRILPAACDYFGQMYDGHYGESSKTTIYTFLREEDPYTEMKGFAQAMEAYDLVLMSDTATAAGDREILLAHDGEICVALVWDKAAGVLAIAYEADIITVSFRENKTVLFLGMKKYPKSDINSFARKCKKVLDTKTEKAETRDNKDRTQALTKDGKKALSLYWYDSKKILTVSFRDGDDPEKLGMTLPQPLVKPQSQSQPQPQPQPQVQVTVDPYSHILPDLASYLNTKYTQDVWGYTHYVTCLINKSNEADVISSLRELLLEPRYQLKERDTWSGTESGKKCKYYSYEYTGKSDEVDWIKTTSGYTYHVRLAQMEYSNTQTAIVFSSHPEFLLKDPGVTWNGGGGTVVPVNPTPQKPDYVNHTGIYILGIMKDHFGTPKKEDYNEERYETYYTYDFKEYPKDRANKLIDKMESLGLKCTTSSFSSGGGQKEFGVKAEGGTPLLGTWKKKDGQLVIRIKWEYVKKAGIFDSADIPAEPAPAPDPNPEPGKIDCPDCTDGRCNTCGGDGKLDDFMSGIKGKQDDIEVCKDCHAGTCKTCYGNGKING